MADLAHQFKWMLFEFCDAAPETLDLLGRIEIALANEQIEIWEQAIEVSISKIETI